MPGRITRQIEVADAIWGEVPTHRIQDAVDSVVDASCVRCGLPIEIGGAPPAAMRAYIEPEGKITLALVHQECGDSRVIQAPADQHPAEFIDALAPFRWRAHLRARRPGAMLLWDNPTIPESDGDADELADVFRALGFVTATEGLKDLDPPWSDSVQAVLEGEDLALLISNPAVDDPELMTFPRVTDGPWIEQARLDQQIVVLYGRIHLGRSPIGFAYPAIEAGEVLAGTVAYFS